MCCALTSAVVRHVLHGDMVKCGKLFSYPLCVQLCISFFALCGWVFFHHCLMFHSVIFKITCYFFPFFFFTAKNNRLID